MVISRPCTVFHKRQIIVAAIERFSQPPPRELNTLVKVRQFLEQLRDGFGSPDRFYLGQQIPNYPQEGRFFARLDSLHTVKLPPSEELTRVVAARRIATLSEDFRRDLHRRVFSAVEELGFADYGWYPDQDLEWLIAIGRQELSPIEKEISEKEAEIANNIASGNRDRNQGLNQAVEKLKLKAVEIRQEVGKYEAERANRGVQSNRE